MADADDDIIIADADAEIPVYLLLSFDIPSWNRWRSAHPRIVFAIDPPAVRQLVRADLTGADLSYAVIRGADLSRAILHRADLTYADLTGTLLTHADLTRADLTSAPLRWADFTDADLRWADFTDANLFQATLFRANLTDATLRGANLTSAALSNANLTNANLARSKLHLADLRRVNLTNADLTGVDLRGANLIDADLTGVDLTNADLRGANLINADLRGVDLTNVDLTNAIRVGEVRRSLDDAKSSPATLFVALTELRLVLPDGVDPTDVADIVGAVAALARLVVTVGVDIAPSDPETQGSTAVAVATRSPDPVDLATIRLHYGSDFIQWLGESWHWLGVAGGVTGGGGLVGLAVKDLLERGDSKVLALLRTIFSRTGRDTLTSTLDAKNDEQLAAARAAVAKHNSDTVRDLAETVENAVRFFKAVEQFPPTTQEQAQANIAATHLTDNTQQALIDALGSLSPLLSQGLTATTILTTQGDDNPQLD